MFSVAGVKMCLRALCVGCEECTIQYVHMDMIDIHTVNNESVCRLTHKHTHKVSILECRR